jgi:hypothetical protein
LTFIGGEDHRRMLVVLDSNALFNDGAFTGGATGRLLALSRRGMLHLAVPEVVLLEVERQHRVQVLGKIDQLRKMPQKAREAARVLGMTESSAGITIWPTEFDAESIMTNYRIDLRRRLHDANVEVLSIPAVEHRELLERDLGGRPPFDPSGKGYRDALIWHSILDRCSTLTARDRVMFVTNDLDFGRDQVDGSLLAELPSGAPLIVKVDSLQALLEGADLRQLESDLKAELRDPPAPGRDELDPEPLWMRGTAAVEAAVRAAIDSLDGAWVDIPIATLAALDVPRAVRELEIAGAGPTGNFEWSPYEEMDSTLLGQAAMDAVVVLSGWVAKADAAILAADDIHIDEWDGDFALVNMEREARLIFDLRLDLPGEQVDGLRFTAVEPR